MLVASDLDGTIDANPREMQSILEACRAAGHTVAIVTGVSGQNPTQQDWQEKSNYLESLGCGACYDTLVVIGHTDGDLADMKAQWLVENHASVFFDNTVENVKIANKAGIPLCLVNWSARIKDK